MDIAHHLSRESEMRHPSGGRLAGITFVIHILVGDGANDLLKFVSLGANGLDNQSNRQEAPRTVPVRQSFCSVTANSANRQ